MDLENALVANNLEMYLPMFRLHNIRSDIAPQLTADDLIEVGVESLGHRIRILKLISDRTASDEQFNGFVKRSDSTRSGRPPYRRAVFSTSAVHSQRSAFSASPTVHSPLYDPASPVTSNTNAAYTASTGMKLPLGNSGSHNAHTSPPPASSASISTSISTSFAPGKTRSFSLPESTKQAPLKPPLPPQTLSSSLLKENAVLRQRVESNEHQIKRLNDTLTKLRADLFKRFKEIEPLPNPLERNDHYHDHHHHDHHHDHAPPSASSAYGSSGSGSGSGSAPGSNNNSNGTLNNIPSVRSPGETSTGSLTPNTLVARRISIPALPPSSSHGHLNSAGSSSLASGSSAGNKPHLPHQISSSTLSTLKQDQTSTTSKRNSIYDSKRSPQDSYFTRTAAAGSSSAMNPNGSIQSPTIMRANSVSRHPHPGSAASSAPNSATTAHGVVPQVLPSLASPSGLYSQSDYFSASNPNLTIQNSNATSHGEPYKKLRCGESDDATRVLSSMFRRYHLEGDLSQWRLQIMYGDKSRDLLDHEFPLVIFKQLQEQGHKPMFHAKKIQPPKPPQGSYI